MAAELLHRRRSARLIEGPVGDGPLTGPDVPPRIGAESRPRTHWSPPKSVGPQAAPRTGKVAWDERRPPLAADPVAPFVTYHRRPPTLIPRAWLADTDSSTIAVDDGDPYARGSAMSEDHTTAAVQRYLDALAGDTPADPIIRALLDRAVRPAGDVVCQHALQQLPAPDAAAAESGDRTRCSGPWSSGCSRPCARFAPGPCASSSPWPTSTCAGSSMTWPAA